MGKFHIHMQPAIQEQTPMGVGEGVRLRIIPFAVIYTLQIFMRIIMRHENNNARFLPFVLLIHFMS